MRYVSRQIVFREIPQEISLAYLISGCQRRCPGCHSADSWNSWAGNLLSVDSFSNDLSKYRLSITCVLFFGGEWHQNQLTELLVLARQEGLKTALYSGETGVSDKIVRHLDYLKLGPYVQALGGLESPRTNQRLINLNTGECLNRFFHQKEVVHHDQIERQSAQIEA